jgi:hypothetical protein
LSSKATQKLYEKLGNINNNDLGELPRGKQTFAGVTFSISDALIQVASLNLKRRPEKVEGIPIGKSFERLYLLQGTAWKVPDGTVIGEYQVHYAGGAVETIPIIYGDDVRDWNTAADRSPAAKSVIGWTGTNTYTRRFNRTIRLYVGVWDNPRPEERVEAIDFITANTNAAPFCVAMTME